MALIEEKLSQRTATTIIANGEIHIILPDGLGGFESWRIAVSDFLADINSAITNLETYVNQALKTDKLKNQSADFSKALGSDVKLESIDYIHVSGTPNVKVGTSAGASDVIPPQSFSSGALCNNRIKYFEASTTLYVTITGGTIDIIFNYRQNYNA